MTTHELPRREFLKMLACAFPATVLDWNALPLGRGKTPDSNDYDAVIIGSGLGGLCSLMPIFPTTSAYCPTPASTC